MKRCLENIGLLLLTLTFCACEQSKVFERQSAGKTGIDFINQIEENDVVNVRNFMNIYTGAGVAVGDVNNDGLQDLYFSGNMVSGRLYLNKGDLSFEDITSKAGLENSSWGTGTTMIDVNQDGWTDIYVAVSGSVEPRENLLYINNKDNTFSEMGKVFGIADDRQTMHSAFFDYDKDGDLDLFLIINPAAYEKYVNTIQPRKLNGESESTDVLYRNNGDNTFTDVSKEAGILIEGYSLGLAISDIDDDGWPDIYISNDFIGNDIMYINDGDGTFTNEIDRHIKHSSYAGMGNDIADINDDGLVDIMVLDMRPSDNLRQKLIISSTGFDRFQLMLDAGYAPQYTRNTLQINRGSGLFSETSFYSGVSSTDWSWSSLFADYDNDGDKDLFVTNGFLRDLGNLDYIHYSNIYNNPIGDRNTKMQSKLEGIKSLEKAALRDFVFENLGNAKFADQSKEWGITEKGVSHGALFADLDNDGDLEIVVNNVNESAHIYKNVSADNGSGNFLKIQLEGGPMNKEGVGTKIKIKVGPAWRFYQHFLSRGYESSVDPIIHFGVGDSQVVDSVQVIWPNGEIQLLTEVQANQMLDIRISDATASESKRDTKRLPTLFYEGSKELGINFNHKEDPFVDFKNQPILPHMHSRYGPGMAVGDVNGDGYEDFFVGGASGQEGRLYLQTEDAAFEGKVMAMDIQNENMGSLLFDADNDGDLDLYIANGGSSFAKGSMNYQDKVYFNDGEGRYQLDEKALPEILESTSTVIGCDYDKDGDIDLFVGGRVSPGEYPLPTQSRILLNESSEKGIVFRDVTEHTFQGEGISGMVSSALWTDFNDDGWIDLVVTGEFMAIRFFENQMGHLIEVTDETGLQNHKGWWNSLTAGDFDKDGDMDYLVGNLGLNSRFVATANEPLCIYAKDYDNNGKVDPILCYFINGENHIGHTRDEVISQINAMRGRFKTYQSYAEVSFDESFLPEELETAYLVQSERFESSYIENLGGGKFRMTDLPGEVQLSPVFGMSTADFDEDGNLDALIVGNFYGGEVATGHYDASVGLILRGDGKGNFKPMPLSESGFAADLDSKALVNLRLGEDKELWLVANNDGPVQSFVFHGSSNYFQVLKDDTYAMVKLKDGSTYRHEFYYGATYLSQPSRNLRLTNQMIELEVVNTSGERRKILANSKLN